MKKFFLNNRIYLQLAVVFLLLLNIPPQEAPREAISLGSYLFVLDKYKMGNRTVRAYVELVTGQVEDKETKFWITYTPGDSRFELYDNSWFDRLLKPTTNIKRAHVLRTVQTLSVDLDRKHFEKIKNRKNLYRYYPNNNMIPISNLDKPMLASDFNLCDAENQPQRKNGEPCSDRGGAVNLPKFMWKEIESVLKADTLLNYYYEKGLITPPMVAAATHLETKFNPLLENKHEKDLCAKGDCTPYKWGRGVGQMGDNETVRLWKTHWKAPINHKEAYVRNFERVTKRTIGDCKFEDKIPRRCENRLRMHIAQCREYERLTGGISHVFCFRPAFHMFAMKMAIAFGHKTSVWKQEFKKGQIHVKPKPILKILDEVAGKDDKRWFAMWARIRAGYINRGAMINLSLQECINRDDPVQCSYGNLSNVVARRPSSTKKLGTPAREVGAQILKGEFINRCHVWAFAGLCGRVRKNSLLDQYNQGFTKKLGKLPKPQRISL